jgi:exonuclease VII small subunit
MAALVISNQGGMCCTASCSQVLAVAEKRKTALKRKIGALQVSSKEKLEEAEKKMTKIHSQASKLPNLSNMLKAAFM